MGYSVFEVGHPVAEPFCLDWAPYEDQAQISLGKFGATIFGCFIYYLGDQQKYQQ